MSNGKNLHSHLPSFGRKNKYRNNSDHSAKLPNPDSFSISTNAKIELPRFPEDDPSTDFDEANSNSSTSKSNSSIQNAIDHLIKSSPKSTSANSTRSKKSFYLAASIIAGLVLLIFAGIGIYSTFFREDSLSIKAERELRRAKDSKILSEDDIPSKSSSEMTDEERANNDYIWYKVDNNIHFELEELTGDIFDRFGSSEITFAEAKIEYEKLISSRSNNSEKALILISESDFVAYTIEPNNDEEEKITLMGELLLRAEELSPTIASASKLADWEYFYGSEDKSKDYYQLMYQRELDGGYINELDGGVENE